MPAITRPTLTKFNERGQRENATWTEAVAVDGSGSTRRVWLRWGERFLGSRAIVGFSQLEYSGLIVTGLRRLTPLPHPDNTGNYTTGAPYLFASGVQSIRPFKVTGNAGNSGIDSSGRSNYLNADVEIQYANPRYVVLSEAQMPTWPADEWQRFVRIDDSTTTGTYIMLPGGTLKYWRPDVPTPTVRPNGIPINFNFGKVVSVTELKLTWCRLPFALYSFAAPTKWQKRIWGYAPDAIDSLLGTVNKTAFLGYAPGCLLFSNIKPIPRASIFDITEWDFEITLGIDPNGWNYKYYSSADPSDTARGWYKVASDMYYADGSTPDEKSIYNERELRHIFDVRDTIP